MSGTDISYDAEIERLQRKYEREYRARLDAEAIAEQVTRDALHDQLTGLANRTLFMDRLQRALDNCARYGRSVVVLLLDLDGFREINDSLGHADGDRLLRAVAGRLSDAIGLTGTLARLEGDEFGLLVEESREMDMTTLAELVGHSLKAPFVLSESQHTITASLGLASSRTGRESPAEIMRQADIAMDAASDSATSRHALYETGMHKAMLFRLGMKADLRLALERNEFVVQFQPIVELPDGALTGMEALVRWQRPNRSMVAPGDFIPLAEETGDIVPLGWWVLEESCRRFRQWQCRYPGGPGLTLHVNISAHQLRDPQATARVLRALRLSGLPAGNLVLELTEGSIMDDVVFSMRALQKMAPLGVRISIDDFGTGYSSLSYLQKLPISGLKIDKSFVDAVPANTEGSELVRAIVNIGSALHLELVAEGVENLQQVSFLHDLGCTFAQGYYFSRPLDSTDIDKHLSAPAAANLPWTGR